jgi:hypothetical protein
MHSTGYRLLELRSRVNECRFMRPYGGLPTKQEPQWIAALRVLDPASVAVLMHINPIESQGYF